MLTVPLVPCLWLTELLQVENFQFELSLGAGGLEGQGGDGRGEDDQRDQQQPSRGQQSLQIVTGDEVSDLMF